MRSPTQGRPHHSVSGSSFGITIRRPNRRAFGVRLWTGLGCSRPWGYRRRYFVRLADKNSPCRYNCLIQRRAPHSLKVTCLRKVHCVGRRVVVIMVAQTFCRYLLNMHGLTTVLDICLPTRTRN